MICRKLRIRPVAFFAMVMLLLCQTLASALAYGTFRAPPQITVLKLADEAPCHDAGASPQQRSSNHGCQDRCPAHDASLETGQLHIPAAHELQTTVWALAPVVSHTTDGAPDRYLATPATPPPLILVYCRLLN